MVKSETRRRPTPRVAPASTPEPVVVPRPSAVYSSWFPAIVRVPTADGGRHTINNAKVLATPEGVYVYDRVPLDPRQEAEVTPAWFAPVNYGNTPQPPTGIKARNGITLATDGGPVIVTPLGGCGCSARKLRDWSPSWATVVRAWPAEEV